jgi:hypothetical protein
MCAQFLSCIHCSAPFPATFPIPLVPTAHPKTCSALLFSDFVEEKKKNKKFLFV